ncbi:MAG: GntR family transcriptional regulator [Arthrobacter sp.]|jgi:DNA-binding GntR family transcriptional regulator|nr:GntR family transcriptional regulator [Arthrobacter sp.]
MKASDRAYEALRGDIVEWRLSPGAPLPEVELGERLGLSRTPVREAIARLVADGLAIQSSGRLVVSPVSPDAVDRLFDARQVLEVATARLAAASPRRAVAGFSRLADAFDEAAADGSPAAVRFYDLAGELDRQLDQAAANPYLAQALRGLRLHLARVRRVSRDHPERLVASAGEHASIARAVALGDAELAAAATVMHLHHSLANIKSHASGGSAASEPTDQHTFAATAAR